jgi:hypothetical protein
MSVRKSGNFAKFTAIRIASSRVSSLGCRSPPRLILEINTRELLSVAVAHDEAGGLFLDDPGRREAASS